MGQGSMDRRGGARKGMLGDEYRNKDGSLDRRRVNPRNRRHGQ